MIAQSADPAVETAETTSTATAVADAADTAAATEASPAVAESTPGEESAEFGTHLGDLLRGMEIPDDVRETELAAAKKESGQPQPPPAAGAETEPSAADKAAAAADPDNKPLPDEWPESARAQVMEERKKRQRRTEELSTERTARETAENRVRELEAQLERGKNGQAEQAPVARATDAEDPTANVWSFEQLNRVHSDFQQEKKNQEEILDFAARYPRGVERVFLGKDEKGEEIRRDYTEEDIADLHVRAQQKLRKIDEAIKPGGALHRRQDYLQGRAQHDPLARKLYTDKERTASGLPALGAENLVFDDKGQLTTEARTIIGQMPGILHFPDALLNIGRYLRGLSLEQKELAELAKKSGKVANGNGNLPEHLKPFARQQPPIAASGPAARTPGTPAGGRTNVDLDKAEQRVIETGGQDEAAIDALFETSLEGSSNRSRAPV